MSNCTQMTGHSWSYRLLNLKLTILFVRFQIWWLKTSNSPPPFFNDRAFQNSNCSERRSFQIMSFWQMIGKWLGIAYIDWCGNKMRWIWCFQSSNLKSHKQYCQFEVQLADHLSKAHNLKASPFRAIRVLKSTIIEKWRWLIAAKKMNEHVELGVHVCWTAE
jgi:hypothetical protein